MHRTTHPTKLLQCESTEVAAPGREAPTGAKASAGCTLGNHVKTIFRPADRKGGEKARDDRYRLLGIAQRIIFPAADAAGCQYPGDYHRTADCHRVPLGAAVAVVHSPQHGRASFAGLATCGSVWACPVCAARVGAKRREEVGRAVDWAYSSNLQPVMVTLTFPHRAWHSLKALLTAQSKAQKSLRSGRPWTAFVRHQGYKGLIQSLEVTHGANGWHPHTHALWFVRRDADAEAIREEVGSMWESACIRAGLLDPQDAAQLEAFRAHAVDVKGNCSASAYLAKQDDSRHWGADAEIALATSKKGRAKGLHPFGLLAKAGEGDKRAARLFLAYIIAFKGKRQLLWSPGLKAAAGVEVKTDEQLAAERETEDSVLLGLLPRAEWSAVLKAGIRAEVLAAAETGGWPAVRAVVERLTGPPR